MKLSEDRLRALSVRTLVRHGLREVAAIACARKLVDADADANAAALAIVDAAGGIGYDATLKAADAAASRVPASSR